MRPTFSVVRYGGSAPFYLIHPFVSSSTHNLRLNTIPSSLLSHPHPHPVSPSLPHPHPLSHPHPLPLILILITQHTHSTHPLHLALHFALTQHTPSTSHSLNTPPPLRTPLRTHPTHPLHLALHFALTQATPDSNSGSHAKDGMGWDGDGTERRWDGDGDGGVGGLTSLLFPLQPNYPNPPLTRPNPPSTLPTPHPHSTLRPPPSALQTPHSTLHSTPSLHTPQTHPPHSTPSLHPFPTPLHSALHHSKLQTPRSESSSRCEAAKLRSA
ncbi:hypothetical protein F5877DRAFT_81786 [Lentinula edodes]|nr:hypothetical protein F5877DRAFT_81786 [Lentinula edodes]